MRRRDIRSEDQQIVAQDLEAARAAIQIEKEALGVLAQELGQNFSDAVEVIYQTKGRLIISGMGKSGHIANKIAATMASTGTPAFAVHPGEASHGDLGMIMPEDTVLALSNSGNTAELSDLLAYTRRFNIPLIGITANADSVLGKQSDVTLAIPTYEEACPLHLAPTTSTAMMLALGDALAIALLKRNQFTADDFKKFHPGGSLGAQLQIVEDVMHKRSELPLVFIGTDMSHALVVMSEKSFGVLGVLHPETEELIGIITDGDLRREMSADLLSKKVEDIMTKGAKTIDGTSLAAEALAVLQELKITSLFIVNEQSQPLGLIHMHDLIRQGVA